MDTHNHLIDLLFSGGTALAGLILVFLGGILTAYDSYDQVSKDAIRVKYKRRATLAFSGFALSLLSAISALVANWSCPTLWLRLALGCLVASFCLVVIVAIQAVRDIT